MDISPDKTSPCKYLGDFPVWFVSHSSLWRMHTGTIEGCIQNVQIHSQAIFIVLTKAQIVWCLLVLHRATVTTYDLVIQESWMRISLLCLPGYFGGVENCLGLALHTGNYGKRPPLPVTVYRNDTSPRPYAHNALRGKESRKNLRKNAE